MRGKTKKKGFASSRSTRINTTGSVSYWSLLHSYLHVDRAVVFHRIANRHVHHAQKAQKEGYATGLHEQEEVRHRALVQENTHVRTKRNRRGCSLATPLDRAAVFRRIFKRHTQWRLRRMKTIQENPKPKPGTKTFSDTRY